MIKKYFLFLITFISFVLSEDPFVVVLMVKNEEPMINKTLEPFVKEGINSFLIFDTGSTDNTIKTVEAYFNKNDVKNWFIFQEEFVDFSTSRNPCFRFSRGKVSRRQIFF